jgi:hypothetical protein
VDPIGVRVFFAGPARANCAGHHVFAKRRFSTPDDQRPTHALPSNAHCPENLRVSIGIELILGEHEITMPT